MQCQPSSPPDLDFVVSVVCLPLFCGHPLKGVNGCDSRGPGNRSVCSKRMKCTSHVVFSSLRTVLRATSSRPTLRLTSPCQNHTNFIDLHMRFRHLFSSLITSLRSSLPRELCPLAKYLSCVYRHLSSVSDGVLCPLPTVGPQKDQWMIDWLVLGLLKTHGWTHEHIKAVCLQFGWMWCPYSAGTKDTCCP